jgi:hypothetical protein
MRGSCASLKVVSAGGAQHTAHCHTQHTVITRVACHQKVPEVVTGGRCYNKFARIQRAAAKYTYPEPGIPHIHVCICCGHSTVSTGGSVRRKCLMSQVKLLYSRPFPSRMSSLTRSWLHRHTPCTSAHSQDYERLFHSDTFQHVWLETLP